VVFGAAMHADGPSAELRARLDHALALWRMGVAPLIMVSGGVDAGRDEVKGMTAYLVGKGVPGDAVVPARPGATTRQSLRTLRGLRDQRYVAVSSPYHALRIRAEARRQGLRVTVSAPASTPETRDATMHRVRFASELFALVWYALPPRLTARVATGPGTLRHVAPRVLAGRAHPSALLTRRRPRPS
jgi:vancomycin permeability regulator SanA